MTNLHLTPRLGSLTRESRQRASWYIAQRLHETLITPRHSGFEPIITANMPLEHAPDSAPMSRPGDLVAD
jgi:hypothetical protein